MTITDSQHKLLNAIATHGPLTFNEAATATGSQWSVVHHEVEVLKRCGYVVISEHERIRLTANGRHQATAQEAQRG